MAAPQIGSKVAASMTRSQVKAIFGVVCKTVNSVLALKQMEPAAGGQGVGVAGSQDPQLYVEDLPVFGLGFL